MNLSKLKLINLLFILLVICFLNFPLPVNAEDSTVQTDDLDKQIEELTKKIQAAQEQQRTLSSAISQLDNKIKLTTISIIQTERKLEELEKEIASLSVKIGRLDESLTSISRLLLERIIETYKKGNVNPLYLFLTSDGFSQFLTRYQYLKIIQLHDRKLLYQMEQTRANYDAQKNLKEEKQKEVEWLKSRLEKQKRDLNQQKESKKILLEETKGKEAEYQRILARLKSEKARLGTGIGHYVVLLRKEGNDYIMHDPVFGPELSFNSRYSKLPEFKVWSGTDNYFNQRDSRWAWDLINADRYYDSSDPSYMWKYGCAVTSMAMVLKKWGVDIDPKRLAALPIYDKDLIAWSGIPKHYGGQINGKGHGFGGYPSWREIDQYLSKGIWVIVYRNSSGVVDEMVVYQR